MSQTIPVQANIYAREGKIYQVNISLNEKGIFCWKLEGDQELFPVVEEWIEAYLRKESSSVYIPLDLKGIPSFSLRVLKAMQQIPFGSTATYQEIAKRAGSPRAARAVGTFCQRNPFPLFVPCHRVVAADGIGGYSCLELKKVLLEHEVK